MALIGFLGLARSDVAGTPRGSACCGVGGVGALAPLGATKPAGRPLVSGEAGAARGPAGRAGEDARGRPRAWVAVGGAGVSDGESGSSGVGTQRCAWRGRRSHLCDQGARGNLFVGGIKASCTLINLLGFFNIEETPVPAMVHSPCGGLERSA